MAGVRKIAIETLENLHPSEVPEFIQALAEECRNKVTRSSNGGDNPKWNKEAAQNAKFSVILGQTAVRLNEVTMQPYYQHQPPLEQSREITPPMRSRTGTESYAE